MNSNLMQLFVWQVDNVCRLEKTGNLTKADLRQAKNYSIRPDSNKIKKAKFSLPEAMLLLYGLDIELEE